MLLTDEISEQITYTPAFGQSVVEAGQTVHLLAENSDRPGTWWAWNPTGTIDLVTPTEDSRGSEAVDPASLALQIVRGFQGLQERLERWDRINATTATRMTDIRDYAVAAHERGDICLQGLRDFLEAFDLDPYPGTIEVSIAMYGSATINAADVDTAISRVRYLLDGFAHSGESSDDDFTIELGSIEVDERDM